MKITKEEMERSLRANFMLHDIFSVSDMERKHYGHWFDRDTMRFFKSRIMSNIFPSKTAIYFVSSEQNDNRPRLFTVRKYDIKNDDISTIGEFQGYESKTKALTSALNLAYNE